MHLCFNYSQNLHTSSMSQNHIYHSWILEFLVQQPIEDKLLDSLLSVLPLPNHDSRVPKLLLLRKLQSNVCHGISENILDFLEKIYQLDQSSGLLDCSEFLRKAYCDVAVECSVRCLRSSGNDVKGEFFEVVKRLWRGRVRKMEGGNVGLVSKELLEWRDEIEAAVWEEDVCLRVVERGKEVDGVEAVMVYLENEKSRMGPSFIEVVSETLGALRKGDGGDRCGIRDVEDPGFDRCDKGKSVVVDGGKGKGNLETERMGTSFLELVSKNLGTLRNRDGGDRCGTSDVEDPGFGNGEKAYGKGKSVVVDGGKGNSRTKRKRAAYKHARPITSRSCRGVKIVDVED